MRCEEIRGIEAYMKEYPGFLTEDSEPFDPVELAKKTEEIICRGSKRKYTDFYCVGVYGGISTGYTVGCCLRCVFCWVDWSRDFPDRIGEFYSPQEAFNNLKQAADERGIRKMRISGAEPTLGKQHLLALLELVEQSEFSTFILETNGIMFGTDKDYAYRLGRFKKPHIRLSLKAGTPETFERKTGAKRESFEIPFRAIEHLKDAGVSFHVAAMSADPRFMGDEERVQLIKKLWEIDRELVYDLEEEVVDPYDTTLKRLEYAGWKVDFPLRERWDPVKSVLRNLQQD
ncbi:MAG: radical SAM protein [Thermoplasmata archaeon]